MKIIVILLDREDACGLHFASSCCQAALSPVTHLHNFLLSSHDKYLHGGTTSIYIMRPSNNRDQAHVSPSANLKCKFSRTRNTNTHHRRTAEKHRHTICAHMAFSMPEFGSSSIGCLLLTICVREDTTHILLSGPSCYPFPKYGNYE